MYYVGLRGLTLMANSPLVSIRIPDETLKRLDNIAQKLHPSRRTGKNPNRSQVILDAIEQFIIQQESELSQQINIEEQVNQVLEQYQRYLEQRIQEYIDQKFVAYARNLENNLQTSRRIHPKTLPSA